MAQPENDTPTIILSHPPDYFETLKLPYELMLADHTHGEQVRLPQIGAIVTPSQFGTKYVAGWVMEGKCKIFVTIGTGTSIAPIRFLCAPEIVALTIKKSSPPIISSSSN